MKLLTKNLNLEKIITNFRNQANKIYDNELKILSTISSYNNGFNPQDNYRLD